MFKIKSAARIAITIAMATATLVWVASAISLIPNPQRLEVKRQLTLTRAIAVSVSEIVERNRFSDLNRVLEQHRSLQSDILSIGIRSLHSHSLRMSAGPHNEVWQTEYDSRRQQQVSVDIYRGRQKWGQLEIAFRQSPMSGNSLLFSFPNNLSAFLTSGVALVAWLVLANTFRYLNPSRVVPDRVRTAFDSIAGGLVLVSDAGEIAHANMAFAQMVQRDRDALVGRQLNEFAWSIPSDRPKELPWSRCKQAGETVSGEIIEGNFGAGITQKYMVNASSLLGSNNQARGMLVSFEDVTALESKKAELAKIIQAVRLSRDEVERQNEQLSFLASYDTLTKCMNRRTFFSQFESLWQEAEQQNLTAIMLDIDYFKSVNDNHGHSTGDQVLAQTAERVLSVVGKRGLVCRYGGEEFAMLLMNHDVETCVEIAESIRRSIEEKPVAGLSITASLGLSNISFGPTDPQNMLDQADQCLYAAKRNGRNQVVRFDRCPVITETETKKPRKDDRLPDTTEQEIEYSSVTGLLSALSFRSIQTAMHSVRVADLAVGIGQCLLDNRELYRLEIAALLHDIGKIGVPDAILNNDQPLTQEEWQIMQRHDKIGITIVRNALNSESIAAIIERHHLRTKRTPNFGVNSQKSAISASILDVCDAFDSMQTDQVYRKGISSAAALEEIQRNCPSQFDPIVVSQLIEFVKSGRYTYRANVNVGQAAEPVCGKHVDDTDDDLLKLLEVANEVVELCSQARSQLVDLNATSEAPVRFPATAKLTLEKSDPLQVNARSDSCGVPWG